MSSPVVLKNSISNAFSNNVLSANASTVVSDEEKQRYLMELQDQTTTTMIPAMVLLIIMAVTGLIGNSLVVFVYSHKFRGTSTRILIIVIAAFDLVANAIAIPGEIYDMFHIWDFDNPALCSSRLFFSAFTTLSSAMALLVIAVIRYRKVCTPYGWQISTKQAQLLSIFVSVLGILFSIPYGVLNGRQTKKTQRPEIFGVECTTDDKYKETIWPLLNYGFFLILFICCCSSLTILYILIGVKAWKHSKIHGSPTSRGQSTAEREPSSSFNVGEPTTSKGNRNNMKYRMSLSTEMSDSCSDRVSSMEMKDVMDADEATEVMDSLGEYTVQILDDRIEIRTQMMGDYIIHLQKTYSRYDATGLKNESPDLNSCGQTSLPIADTNNHMEMNTITKLDVNNDNFVNESDDYSVAGSEIEKSELNQTNEISKINHQMIGGTCDNNPMIPQILAGRKLLDQSIHTLAIESNQNQNNEEHSASLKWIDTFYCPQNQQADNQDKATSTKLSFQISSSNNLIQKNEWLQKLIEDVLSKAKYKFSDAPEMEADESLDMHKGDSIIWKNTNPEEKDKSTITSVQMTEFGTSVGKRFKRLVSKSKSLVKTESQRGKLRRKPIGRTTAMLIIISAIYTLSFVPHLSIMFYKFSSPDKIAAMTMVEQSFYNLFLRTYFLNCAANPIIYSLCDVNFRKQCWELFSHFSR